MKIRITSIVKAETDNVLLAVFSPDHGWAGPAVVAGSPQMYPGRVQMEVDLLVASPADAARQLNLILPDTNNQPPC